MKEYERGGSESEGRRAEIKGNYERICKGSGLEKVEEEQN